MRKILKHGGQTQLITAFIRGKKTHTERDRDSEKTGWWGEEREGARMQIHKKIHKAKKGLWKLKPSLSLRGGIF